jgi:hypothetical protein
MGGTTEQNPYAGTGPVLSKVLVVCPVSLVNVRGNEIHLFLFLAIKRPLTELEGRIPQMVR